MAAPSTELRSASVGYQVADGRTVACKELHWPVPLGGLCALQPRVATVQAPCFSVHSPKVDTSTRQANKGAMVSKRAPRPIPDSRRQLGGT